MATAKLINIEDAKLQTLSVEIKAMTVNGKQMTLSTFRQLPERNIFAVDYKLDGGVPWGLVRYHWGDQSRSGFHVVWQLDSVLFRAFLSLDGDPEFWPPSQELTTYLKARAARIKERSWASQERLRPEEDAARTALLGRHSQEMARLERSLPQLFIAV